MADIKLQATKRDGLGKNKVDKIRTEGNVPGILYHRGADNTPVQFEHSEFEKVFREAGTSTIIDVVVAGETHPAIIKDVQRHPYKELVLHCDFQTIRMDEVLRISVPIILEGRDEIRLQPSVLNQILNELDIECLPTDIPEEVSINVIDMDFETPLYVKDLEIFGDDKVTVLHEGDDLLAILSEPQEEEEEEEELEDVDAADVPTVDETEEDGEDAEEEE